MSPFRTLAAKPWLPGSDEGAAWDRPAVPAAWVGLGMFLAVVSVLFLLLLTSYLMRMGFGDWVPLVEPLVLRLNTAILVLGSVALQAAWTGARRGWRGTAEAGFVAGGACALAFLVGQLIAWRQLDTLGYTVASNPADTFFYLLSAMHGLHLAGGLVVWGRVAARVLQDPPPPGLDRSIGLCAVYWHFLLLVWLAVFALMLADNEGIANLPAICRAIIGLE